MTLAGRASPGGAVDDLDAAVRPLAGRPGQVVLACAAGTGSFPLGTKFTVHGPLPGNPVLTVVGTAISVTGSAAGWVAPGEIATLRRQDARSGGDADAVPVPQRRQRERRSAPT